MRIAKRSGLRKAKVAVARKLAVLCIACGSTAPNSNGRRRLPLNRHNRVTTSSSSRIPAGDDVPAGTLAVVRSSLALRCSTEQNALHTLIHQRHLTPSCGGHAPTAKRTLDPARTIRGELDPRPGIREQPGSFSTFRVRAEFVWCKPTI